MIDLSKEAQNALYRFANMLFQDKEYNANEIDYPDEDTLISEALEELYCITLDEAKKLVPQFIDNYIQIASEPESNSPFVWEMAIENVLIKQKEV